MPQTAYEGNDPYIFINYDQQDATQVLSIITALQDRGFRVWYYTDFTPTIEKQDEIAHRLNNCHVIISFITHGSLNCQSFRQEFNFGIELNKERLLVYLEDVQLSLGMQMRLGLVQNMYFTRHNGMNSFVDELCRSKTLLPCRNAGGYVTANEAYQKGFMCYECGQYSEAVRWLQKAAEEGHAQAMHQLSRCYENGQGVCKSISTAIDWLQKSAEHGHTQAQSELGGVYLQGHGRARDLDKAIFWYGKAAEKNDIDAICCLGITYCQRQYDQDAMEAVRCFQKAARLGSTYAQDIINDLNIPW